VFILHKASSQPHTRTAQSYLPGGANVHHI